MGCLLWPEMLVQGAGRLDNDAGCAWLHCCCGFWNGTVVVAEQSLNAGWCLIGAPPCMQPAVVGGDVVVELISSFLMSKAVKWLCDVHRKPGACLTCTAWFMCNRDHQQAHYQRHKKDCRRIAAALAAADSNAASTSAAAAGPAASAAAAGSGTGDADRTQPKVKGQVPITWEKLEALGGMPAMGKVLELRIVSQPIPFLRHSCEVKDRKNDV